MPGSPACIAEQPKWSAPAKADDEFVGDAERVISQQNEAWMVPG
jgi:hypothetical protein